MKKELSSVKGTVGNKLMENLDSIKITTTKSSLVEACEKVLENLNNKDKNEFLEVLKKKKDHTSALMYVYNYVLKGDNLGVI